jgi:hypothetical protein
MKFNRTRRYNTPSVFSPNTALFSAKHNRFQKKSKKSKKFRQTFGQSKIISILVLN